MRFPKRLIKCTGISAFLILTQLSADFSLGDLPIYELDPYVVVANRTPIQLAELSVSTSYIGSEQLKYFQYNSLSDVLKAIPGTAIVQNGHKGALSSLFTRGTESNHTAVFLNGRRLPAGTMGQYDLSSLGIENLGSVEFIRGPSSSLYGADAIGGVIDLRSREAQMNQRESSFCFEYGSFDSLLGKYELLAGDEKLSLSAGISSFRTKNDRPNSDFERLALNSYAKYKLSDYLYFDFQVLYYKSEIGVPGDERYPLGTPFGTYPAKEINTADAYLFSPGIYYEPNDLTSITAFYSSSQNDFEAVDAPFASNYIFKEKVDELNLIANISPGELPVLITGGFNYLKLEYDRNPNEVGSVTSPFKYSHSSRGIFGQAIFDYSKSLRLIGSARLDHFDRYGNKATGNVELSYLMPSLETRFFLKYGEGVSPPEANDLARLEGQLNVEESGSWEFGFKKAFAAKKVNFGMIYFNSKIRNLVDDDGAWPVANYEVVDTKQSGLESQMDWIISPQINFRLSHTFLEAEVTSGTYFFSDGVGTRLIRRPKHSIAANIDWNVNNQLRIGLGFQSVKDREDPAGTRHEDYELFRLYGDLTLSERISCYGRVENLFNQRFTYTPGYSNSGIALHFGARIKL